MWSFSTGLCVPHFRGQICLFGPLPLASLSVLGGLKLEETVRKVGPGVVYSHRQKGWRREPHTCKTGESSLTSLLCFSTR